MQSLDIGKLKPGDLLRVRPNDSKEMIILSSLDLEKGDTFEFVSISPDDSVCIMIKKTRGPIKGGWYIHRFELAQRVSKEEIIECQRK